MDIDQKEALRDAVMGEVIALVDEMLRTGQRELTSEVCAKQVAIQKLICDALCIPLKPIGD